MLKKIFQSFFIFFFIAFCLNPPASTAQDDQAQPVPQSYYESGQILTDTVVDKDGFSLWRAYYKNGDMMEERRFLNNRIKRHIKFYPDGTVAYLWQVTEGDESQFTLYFPDGSIKTTGHMWNFLLQGPYEILAPDGDVIDVIHYKNNILFGKDGRPVNGVLTYHYKDGHVMETTSFDNGLPHGPQRMYHPDGYLLFEKTYDHLTPVREKVFDRDGQVLYENVNPFWSGKK